MRLKVSDGGIDLCLGGTGLWPVDFGVSPKSFRRPQLGWRSNDTKAFVPNAQRFWWDAKTDRPEAGSTQEMARGS
jgi:hypothetical protein